MNTDADTQWPIEFGLQRSGQFVESRGLEPGSGECVPATAWAPRSIPNKAMTPSPMNLSTRPPAEQVNPEYLAWLLSLPRLERERLLNGNWKIRPAAGLYFKREWCAVADEVPADLDVVRYWDLAATEKTEFNDPDWTVGIKLRSRFRPFQYGPIVHKQPLLRSYPVIQRSNEKVRSHPDPCRRDTGPNPQSPELAGAVRSYP